MTEIDVAEFMLKQLEQEKYLYQDDIVWKIEQEFGEPFFYINENGSYAISKGVLRVFKKLTPNVVWDRREKCWRFREKYDEPIKRQSDQ